MVTDQELEDSGDEDLEPYVRMDTLMSRMGTGVELRDAAIRVNRKVKNNKRENRTKSVISDVSDDYVKREEFIGLKDVDDALRMLQSEASEQR